MTEQEILREIKKCQEGIREVRDDLMALKMGAITFDSIDRQFREVNRKLDNLR